MKRNEEEMNGVRRWLEKYGIYEEGKEYGRASGWIYEDYLGTSVGLVKE